MGRQTKKQARGDIHDVGQIVLVLQGGGALGAYQAGVYEAMTNAGIEPDWVIGTSIGAINGALIAGNVRARRLERLREFWRRVQQREAFGEWGTVIHGVHSFFEPRPGVWAGGMYAPVGAEAASFYSAQPLRETLHELLEEDLLAHDMRLTMGAVSVTQGELRYFDSRDEKLCVDHVLASGALPPAFAAVRIGEHVYWDGGVFSNTPIEAVFDDEPRRSSLIFSVNVWQPTGVEPRSVWEAMGRQKDIQYASRADTHIARQKQIHRLRHVIRELTHQLSEARRNTPAVRELSAWGCGTTMHVVRLLAPTLANEDYWKDIDFSREGIEARWAAGLEDTRKVIECAPWNEPYDATEGVIVHELSARTGMEVKTV